MLRRGRARTAVLAAVALLLGATAAPAAAQAVDEPQVRDALVVDVVNSTSSSASHSRYDSVAGPVPVARASTVLGGVLLARPAGATTGPSVEVLPADGAPLAVGTVSGIRGRWTAGTVRPVPVVRLVAGTDPACTAFQSTPPSSELVVHDVAHDGAGAVVRLSASWRIPCSTAGAVATGEVRYRSTGDYASASSSSTVLARVISGGRAPVTATVVNTGSVPLALGAPVAVERGPSAARLELTAAGEDCSSTPLPVGGRCTLALEHVDDGVAGGDRLAELRLPAPALLRGYVAVQTAAREVVMVPGPATGLRGTSAYDGIALAWGRPSSGLLPDGFRIRRVDGAAPVELASLPGHATTWVDTSLAKGEAATYELAAHTAAGEGEPVRVTVARQDRPDPPPANGRRTLVMDGLAGVGIADTAAGTPVQVSDVFAGTTLVTGAGMQLHLPRLAGAGTFPVGSQPGQLSVLAYGPPATCGSTTGTAEVREAWVRADGTVHRIDADLHLTCAGIRIEVALRLGTDTPFAAVTTDPVAVTDLSGVVSGTSVTRAVSVVNAGTVPAEVGAPSVSGADAADVTATTSTCHAPLEPGARCTVELVFTPRRSGEHLAALAIPVQTAIGTRHVRLQASAVGPPRVRVPEVAAVLGRTLLRWSAVDDGGAPVTGIEVQRAGPGQPFSTVASLPPEQFSWVDTQVAPGQSSRYRLLTQNRYGSVVPDDAEAVSVVGAVEELLAAVSTTSTGDADLMSVRTSEGLPVPVGTGQDADLPAVSPDGRTAAYVVHDADGDPGLWLRSLTGDPAARVLVDAPGVQESDPAWSPDGSQVCYSRLTAAAKAVWCVGTAAGAAPTAFPGGADAVQPSWLPDGSGLVVTDLTAAVTALARITRDGARTAVRGTADGRWPAVSPTGDRVAFVVTDERGLDHLRTVPVAGGTAVDLASSADLYDRPAWAPDSQALAVPTTGWWDAATVTVWTAATPTTPARVETVRAAAGYDVLAVAWRRQDRAGPTVTFPGAPLRTGGAVRLPVRVVDDTVPVGGVTVTCTVDGRAVGSCASGWAGALPAGSHRLEVTARDPHGRSTTAAHVFVVDTAPPSVALAALPVFALAGPVTVAYAASDPSGVASHDVRYRRAAWSAAGFSAPTVPAGWASTTARSRSLPVAAGYEYCVSVRARDRVGNTSAWSAERCTAVPLDDRTLARTTAGWSSATSATAFAGTLTRTSTDGARLVRPSAVARRLAVVATTCPSCGSVDVLVGTTRVGTLSLVSSTTRARQVLTLPLLPSARAGAVTVRARGWRPVLVDGLGLRKT